MDTLIPHKKITKFNFKIIMRLMKYVHSLHVSYHETTVTRHCITTQLTETSPLDKDKSDPGDFYNQLYLS